MLNIPSALNYIDSINSAYLSGSDRAEVSQRIKSIKTKSKDNKLYLAVIGEFSSGKSTFINALLGFKLLKDAVMPTTACATYIECNAPNLSVSVAFFDGNAFSADESNFDVLRDYICELFHKTLNSLQEIITALTSDQHIAKTVQYLHINIPGTAIPQNIVIIDTPGFNPGLDSVDNHQEITRFVVENVADAAIILTSQEQAMSATLTRFLYDNLNRCLHRCSYVVTKFDTLADDETRNEVLQFVRQRIMRDFKINEPKVYGISAITNLPVKQIPLGMEDEWTALRDSFNKFATRTWRDLQTSKDLVLSEHVHSLIKEVATLCAAKLSKRETEKQADKEFLATHRVEAIQSVCDKMVESTRAVVSNSISGIDKSFKTAESNCIAASETTLKSMKMSLLSFKNTMMPKIKAEVESQATNALSDLNNAINNLVVESMKARLAKMSEVFNSHYSQFPSLRPAEKVPTVNLAKFNKLDVKFDLALAKVVDYNSQENKTVGKATGAAAGAGLLIAGPIGALVGAGLGFFFGAGTCDKSDEMLKEAVPLVKEEISNFFSNLRVQVDSELTAFKSDYISHIKEYAKLHQEKYGDAVQTLIEEHRTKLNNLSAQIKSLRNSILGLQSLQDDAEYELALLKLKIS